MSKRSKFISMQNDRKYAEFVDEVIEGWEASDELELRFKLKNKSFEEVSAKFGVPVKIARTIAASSSSQHPAFGLERLEVNLGDKRKEMLMKMMKKNFNIPSIGAKISVASELPLNEISVKLDVYRFKYRETFEFGNFKLDLTLTSTLKIEPGSANAGNVLTQWKDSVGKISATNKKTDLEHAIEVELEWDSQIGIPDKEDLMDDIFIQLDEILSKLGITVRNDTTVYEILRSLIPNAEDWRTLINKPVPLLRESLKNLQSEQYCVTLKYDGERVIVFGYENRLFLMFAGEVRSIELKSNFAFPIIVDGEMYKGTIYVFDVLYGDGRMMASDSFVSRFSLIDEIVGDLNKKDNTFSYAKKKFWMPDGVKLAQITKDALTSHGKNDPPIDGLVFTPMNREYYNRLTYKWKEPSKNSIDFLVKHNGEKLDLYVGISLNIFRSKVGRSYFDVKTFPALVGGKANYGPYLYETIDKVPGKNPEDNTIWEFTWVDGKFAPYIFRKDRTDEYLQGKGVYGNDYGVAEEVKDTMINAISVETLTSDSYFVNITKKGEQEPWQRINNTIKSKLYEEYVDTSSSIAEIAAGRGGDISRWTTKKLKFVLAMDIDGDALDQLMMRWAKLPPDVKNRIEIKTVRCDVLSDCHENLIGYGADKIDYSAVSCMFAVHYFCGSEDDFMKFVTVIKHLMGPKTKCMVTSFDGKQIHHMLKEKEEVKLFNAKKEVFASVKRLYDEGSPLENFGQKISVTISTIGAPHEEYLANYDSLRRVLTREGMKIISEASFSNYSDLYVQSAKRAKKGMFMFELSPDERTFVEMNRYIIFKKA